MINAQTQGSELLNISGAVIREKGTAKYKKIKYMYFYSHMIYT